MVEMKHIVIVVIVGLLCAVIGGLIGRFATSRNDSEVTNKAQCSLQSASGGTGGVTGVIDFTRTDDDQQIKITGTISGLTQGKHGFHVHQTGKLSNQCKDAGGHFNPFSKEHGAPDSSNRHVGDLGNIMADADGVANVNIMDSYIKFGGDAGILGRAVVVHAGEDDLGLGGQSDSKTTGHAGSRVACCIIGAV